MILHKNKLLVLQLIIKINLKKTILTKIVKIMYFKIVPKNKHKKYQKSRKFSKISIILINQKTQNKILIMKKAMFKLNLLHKKTR